MIPKYGELKKLTDEELITAYDDEAERTVVGTGFYLDELARRTQERLASQMRNMTIVITVLTLFNVILVAATVLGWGAS